MITLYIITAWSKTSTVKIQHDNTVKKRYLESIRIQTRIEAYMYNIKNPTKDLKH